MMKTQNNPKKAARPFQMRALACSIRGVLTLGAALPAGTLPAADWVTLPKFPDPLLQNLTIPATAPTQGMWSAPGAWPFIGVHSVLLPNGKVMSWGTNPIGDNQDGRYFDVWDPMKGLADASHQTTFDPARQDSFCATATYLGDGRLMITGGDGTLDNGVTSNIVTPATGKVVQGPNVGDERWYATMLTLPDGRPLIMGGMVPRKEGQFTDPALAISQQLASMTPEIYENGAWSSLFGASSRDAFGPDFLRDSFPRAWVAPNGRVFGVSTETMWFLDPAGTGSISIAGKFKTGPDAATTPNVGPTNSAVMYAPGKVLILGGNGLHNGFGTPGSKRVTAIDINGATPVLTEQPQMSFARHFPNTIILPTGKVLVTGGETIAANSPTNAVYAAEIWDPNTGTWSLGANASVFRGYHSMSTLLADGTVLSVGGGNPGPAQLKGEIYYPPYLFQTVNGVAQLAPRPVIDAIGGLNFAHNGILELDMTSADPVAKLVLVGNSNGTHSFNSGQRLIPLSFTQNGVRLTATVPNANLAPPGYYQVIALNAAGVPSTGAIVSVGPTATPNTAIDLTRNTQVSIKAARLTDQAIGVDGTGLGILQPLSSTAPSTADLAATTFTTRNGLTNANCVSFEQAAAPGKFLRQSNLRMQLGTNDGSAAFGNDATFCPEVGLSGAGVSFRSASLAANLIRYRAGQIWLDPSDDSATFNDSASFFVQTPPKAQASIGSISAPILASGGTASYDAGSVAAGAQYNWDFGDGSAATGFSTTATAAHQYTAPGLYLVTLTVKLADGTTLTKTFIQAVNPPVLAGAPKASSSVLLESRTGASARLWTVNPDNNTVSVFDTANNAKVAEIVVGGSPRTLALAASGRIWVANRDGASLSVISPSTLTVVNTVPMPRASQPFGLVFAPDGSAAYVVLEAGGQLLKLDPVSGATLGSLPIGSHARHLSITADSSQILVSRFITPSLPGESTATVDTSTAGGEVLAINAANFAIAKTITLRHSDKVDNEIQGSGIPNYLSAPVISPDGGSAWVPSKQDNIKRGTLRGTLGLDFQNTVRAISSRINLASLTEDYASRIDHDNSSLGSAAAYHPSGAYLFVALETSRQVAVVNAIGGREIFKVDVGRAPQGLTVSADGLTLYVQNFMDRSVSVLDLSPLVQNGEFRLPVKATLNTIATEALPPAVFFGKQFFYDARDTRLARDSYMSCASCHADAESDGRTWDFTGFGEGLRNTPSLKGRAGTGQGFVHWSANFDEIQDFEGQIRNFAGGTGLMTDAQFATGTRAQPLGDKKAGVSADLDAMAAYLNSLNRFDNTPYRATDGTLTSAAVAGKTVFDANGCGTCHSGPGFTASGDASAMKNVGTLKPTSGKRLNGTLTGIDIPTLRDAWATGPYLHDGSAPTLAAAIQAHQGNTLAGADLDNVAAYLQQIGAEEFVAVPAASAWSFNEGSGTTAADSSGANRPLTLANTTWVAGKVGQALQFNGANASGSTASAVLDTANSFSVATWVRLDALTGWRTMVNQDGLIASGFWLQYSEFVGSKFMLSMHDADANGSSPFRAVGTTTPVVGQWYHVVGVRDKAAGTMKLYVNGKLEGTTAYTGGWAANGTLNVGRGKFNGPNDWLAGALDEVSTYSTALTDADVAQLYAQGTGGVVTPTNVPPTVSLTAPANNASVVQGTAITVSANAADSDGTVARVEFYDGATLIGSDATAPYSLSWTGAAAGAHSVTAKAFDNAGASTTSTAIALTVTTSTVNVPAAGAWSFNEGSGTTAADSSGANRPLTLANTTWVAGKVGQALQFNGANASGSTASAVLDTANSFSVATWVRLDALTGWRTMVNQDGLIASGFWLQYSEFVGSKFMLSMHDADANGSSPFRAVGTTTPVVGQWYHVVGVRDKAAGTMKLYVNGKLEGTTAYTGGWAANGTLNVGRGKFNGPNDWLAGALDEVSTYSTALTDADVAQLYAQGTGGVVTPTNVPPTVSLTAPANNASVVQGTAITVSANAADSDGTVARVEFYDGATLIGSDATAPYSLSWTNAAVGAHSVTAKAFDNAGASTTSGAVTVTVTAPPVNAAPTVALTAPTANASFAQGTAITVSANAADSDGTVARVEFYDGATLIGSDATAPYSLSWTNAAVGAHSVTAKAFDNAGASTTSGAVTVTVTAPPVNAAPTVALTAPTANASFAQGTAITVSANAADSDGTVARVEFYDGTTLIGRDTAAPYSLSWTGAVVGPHSVTARAFDNAGASATSGAVTVNVTAVTPPTWSKCANQGGICYIPGGGTANVRYSNAARGQSAVRSVSGLTFCLPHMFGLPFDSTNTGMCEVQVK